MSTRAFCCRKIRPPTPLEGATAFLFASIKHVGSVLDDMVTRCDHFVDSCVSDHCAMNLTYDSLQLMPPQPGVANTITSLSKLEEALRIVIMSFFDITSESPKIDLNVEASYSNTSEADTIRIVVDIDFDTF